jgi:VanZ family protein
LLNIENKIAFNQNFKYCLPVILWMCFIFWMSAETFSAQNTSLIIEPVFRFLMPGISPKKLDMIHGLIRKCGHVVEYFILGLFLFRAFRCGSKESRTWRWAFSAIIIVVLYAASDEFHQSFVATRTASLVDVGIDIMGGILAQVVSAIWRHRNRKQAVFQQILRS